MNLPWLNDPKTVFEHGFQIDDDELNHWFVVGRFNRATTYGASACARMFHLLRDTYGVGRVQQLDGFADDKLETYVIIPPSDDVLRHVNAMAAAARLAVSHHLGSGEGARLDQCWSQLDLADRLALASGAGVGAACILEAACPQDLWPAVERMMAVK